MTDPATLIAGETLVDFIPDRPGLMCDVDAFAPRPGGAPANVAVAMGRLDAPPWFLTRLATDQFGDFLAERLKAERVTERFIERDETRRTTLAFVTHDSGGDRAFTFYRENAADAHITPSSIPRETFETLERVVLGGVLLTSESGRTASLELADRAREHDCTVIFDPNTRPELWAGDIRPESVLETMLERADIVKTAGDDFARYDYPSAPEQLASRILELGPHTVIVTLGEAGAILHSSDDAPWGAGMWSHDGYPVDPVDTTGAGDAFLGGVLTRLDTASDTSTFDPESTLGFANAVAARTTTAEGAWTALPDRETVDSFRAEHD